MGFWAGIKHALNSTLGTDDFKSLDKMILGMRSLQASDNTYMTYKGGIDKVNIEAGTTQRFLWNKILKPYNFGSMKLKFTYVYRTTSSSYANIKIHIYINDSLAETIESTSQNVSALTLTSSTLRFDANDSITVDIEAKAPASASTTYFKFDSVEVLADLTEFTALNVKDR